MLALVLTGSVAFSVLPLLRALAPQAAVEVAYARLNDCWVFDLFEERHVDPWGRPWCVRQVEPDAIGPNTIVVRAAGRLVRAWEHHSAGPDQRDDALRGDDLQAPLCGRPGLTVVALLPELWMAAAALGCWAWAAVLLFEARRPSKELALALAWSVPPMVLAGHLIFARSGLHVRCMCADWWRDCDVPLDGLSIPLPWAVVASLGLLVLVVTLLARLQLRPFTPPDLATTCAAG